MSLKAVESKEDEKQFKLLYYHFLVKYQFSPQPYCEAAGFQILTVLACAPRREEMPGSEKQKHLLGSPAGLLLELWHGGKGGRGSLQVVSLQAGGGESTPSRGISGHGWGLFLSFLKASFTYGQRGRDYKWFYKVVYRLSDKGQPR